MPRSHDDRPASLLPPGRRWGRGAQSVVPYLTNGRPAGQEAEEVERLVRNPVFLHMEHALRALRRGH